MKIVTAIGIEKLYRRIKDEIPCEILCNDILYEDGIFECLENKNEIDCIIINSEKLLIENIKEFIKRIKEINKNILIIFLVKDKKEIKYEDENVKYIAINNYVFKNIEKEILKTNYIIKESDNRSNNKKEDLKIKENIKIISIAGNNGTGKSIFTANFAKALDKKILIVDFDFLNNSIHTIFGVKKGKEKIININKKIDLISIEEMYCSNECKINFEKIIEIIDREKNNYEYIIIDTSSETFFDITRKIFEYSDCIIFLLEANLLELKKTMNLLKIYKENWNINNEKIKVVINKINKNSIDREINRKIFYENKIVGEIKYSKKYNDFINKNMKNIKYSIFLKNKYKIILKKILLDRKQYILKGEGYNEFRENTRNLFRKSRK